MKKILNILASLVFATSLFASTTTTVTIPIGGVTNVLAGTGASGSVNVGQIVVTAPTGTNASVSLYDSPTNVFAYVVPAYTNTVSYLTNNVWTYTNFFGVTNIYTNTVLVDNTNNLVDASTNLYTARFSGTAIANSSAVFNNTKYYFAQGLWATNTGSGTATLTVTWSP